MATDEGSNIHKDCSKLKPSNNSVGVPKRSNPTPNIDCTILKIIITIATVIN